MSTLALLASPAAAQGWERVLEVERSVFVLGEPVSLAAPPDARSVRRVGVRGFAERYWAAPHPEPAPAGGDPVRLVDGDGRTCDGRLGERVRLVVEDITYDLDPLSVTRFDQVEPDVLGYRDARRVRGCRPSGFVFAALAPVGPASGAAARARDATRAIAAARERLTDSAPMRRARDPRCMSLVEEEERIDVWRVGEAHVVRLSMPFTGGPACEILVATGAAVVDATGAVTCPPTEPCVEVPRVEPPPRWGPPAAERQPALAFGDFDGDGAIEGFTIRYTHTTVVQGDAEAWSFGAELRGAGGEELLSWSTLDP